jgi:hypothetical protein
MPATPIITAWSSLKSPQLGHHLWATAFGFGAPPAASGFGVQAAASDFRVQAAALPSSFVSRPPPPPQAVELRSPLIALHQRFRLLSPSSLSDFGARSSSWLDLVFGSGQFWLVCLRLSFGRLVPGSGSISSFLAQFRLGLPASFILVSLFC